MTAEDTLGSWRGWLATTDQTPTPRTWHGCCGCLACPIGSARRIWCWPMKRPDAAFLESELLAGLPAVASRVSGFAEPTRHRVDVRRSNPRSTHVPADDRGVWLKVGQALKWEFGKSGFGLWSDWSQRSEKYDPEDQDRVWASIRREAADGKVTTAGTIFKLALDNGWKGLQTDPHGEFEPLDPDLVAKLEKPKPATPPRSQPRPTCGPILKASRHAIGFSASTWCASSCLPPSRPAASASLR